MTPNWGGVVLGGVLLRWGPFGVGNIWGGVPLGLDCTGLDDFMAPKWGRLGPSMIKIGVALWFNDPRLGWGPFAGILLRWGPFEVGTIWGGGPFGVGFLWVGWFQRTKAVHFHATNLQWLQWSCFEPPPPLKVLFLPVPPHPSP